MLGWLSIICCLIAVPSRFALSSDVDALAEKSRMLKCKNWHHEEGITAHADKAARIGDSFLGD